jgi:hypothetical protein
MPASTRSNLDGITHLRCGLATYGYRVTPVRGKDACVSNWPNSRWRAAQMEGLARNYPDATNTGLVCGELVALDIDTPDPAVADAICSMVAKLPGADGSPYRIGKAPKRLYIFRTTEPRPKVSTGAYLIGGLKCQLEVFGQRTQFVAYGVHPDTGRAYEWFNGSPAETPLAELPAIAPATVDGLLERAEAYFAERGTLIKRASKPGSCRERHDVVAPSDHPWAILNSRALSDLDAWVPQLCLDGLRRYQAGYHSVASFRPSNSTAATKRGRSLNIQPSGIVDYSAGNTGYSPIDLVATCLGIPETAAADWLRERVGDDDTTPAISVAGLLGQPARRAAAASKISIH